MRKKKKEKKPIFSWIFSIFCLMSVLVYGFSLGSVLLLAMGIMALPIQPIQNIWNKLPFKPNLLRAVILALTFILTCSILPETSAQPESGTGMEVGTEEDSNEESDHLVDNNNTADDKSEAGDNDGGAVVVPVVPSITVEATPEATPTPVPTKKPVATPEEVADFTFDMSQVPEYSGNPYVVINQNVPYFSKQDLSYVSYEYYSALDSFGRCGVCVASVGQDIMPTEERGNIGSVKPTGWHTVKYNGIVSGNYLYNRCHLIGFQLTGENANTKNLITGTRYMNVDGMLPFENMVADYVQETGNHVMYRVTPVFEGKNLLASGVLMEAMSVEDDGEGILFNVFCYNVQPGIEIDYATGESCLKTTPTPTPTTKPTATSTPTPNPTTTPTEAPDEEKGAYAVNANNGKIHMVGQCSATGTGSNAMKNPVYFDTYEDAEAYSKTVKASLDNRKCGNCW